MARSLLKEAPGVDVVDDPANLEYPMPRTATRKYDVEVGRIRSSLLFAPKGLDLFVCGDQLLRGAALNAVLIAEAKLRDDVPGQASASAARMRATSLTSAPWRARLSAARSEGPKAGAAPADARSPAMAAAAVDVPPSRLNDLPLSSEAKVAMREGFGLESQTPVQAHIFGPIMRGVDLLVRAETGAGCPTQA